MGVGIILEKLCEREKPCDTDAVARQLVLIVEDDPRWVKALNDFLYLRLAQDDALLGCHLDDSALEDRWLLKIFVNGVRVFGDLLNAIQDAQRERARSGFNRQLHCTTIIKALHKPLQVIPQSIHPIDAAA